MLSVLILWFSAISVFPFSGNHRKLPWVHSVIEILRPEGEAIDFLCKYNGAVLLVEEEQVFTSATVVFCILFVFVIKSFFYPVVKK